MCLSTPDVQAAPAPPETEAFDTGGAREATRQSDLRRRRKALSRTSTQGAGAMQGMGKTQLGQ